MSMTREAYEAASKLYEENQGLPIWVVQKYFPNLVGDDDVYQNARLGLWKACCSYNASKTQFSTFATVCMQHEISRPFRNESKRNKAVVEVSMNTVIARDSTGDELLLEDILADPIDCINGSDVTVRDFVAQLSERDRFIIALRYAGYSQTEIGKKLGCSSQACSKRINDAKNKYFQINK